MKKPQSLAHPVIFQSTPLQTFQAMRLSNKIHHVEDPTVLEPSPTSHQPQLSDQPHCGRGPCIAYTSWQYILDRSTSSILGQKPYTIVLLRDFHSATSCCFHTSTFNDFPNQPTRAFSVLERQKTKECH